MNHHHTGTSIFRDSDEIAYHQEEFDCGGRVNHGALDFEQPPPSLPYLSSSSLPPPSSASPLLLARANPISSSDDSDEEDCIVENDYGEYYEEEEECRLRHQFCPVEVQRRENHYVRGSAAAAVTILDRDASDQAPLLIQRSVPIADTTHTVSDPQLEDDGSNIDYSSYFQVNLQVNATASPTSLAPFGEFLSGSSSASSLQYSHQQHQHDGVPQDGARSFSPSGVTEIHNDNDGIGELSFRDNAKRLADAPQEEQQQGQQSPFRTRHWRSSQMEQGNPDNSRRHHQQQYQNRQDQAYHLNPPFSRTFSSSTRSVTAIAASSASESDLGFSSWDHTNSFDG